MLKRAYSVLTVKAADDESRILTGMATTPTADSFGDIVDPEGAEFSLPLPLLSQHDSSKPIGRVTEAKVTKDGIEISAQIESTDEAGALKERLDTAWQEIKLGLVRGLSIGFRSIEHTFIDETFGIHFIKWKWLELSAVTIPANEEATVQAIKSIDEALRGENRRRPIVHLHSTDREHLSSAGHGVSTAGAPDASALANRAAKRGSVQLITRNSK